MAIKGVKFSEEHKQALREAATKRDKSTYRGVTFPKGLIPWNKGKATSDEAKKKMSESKLKAGIKPPPRTGCKPWNYEGGKAESHKNRHPTLKVIAWRKACLERDNRTCKKCGSKEKLHVHHIKGWVDFPELRYEVSNGITYCSKCHFKLTWAEKKLIINNLGRDTCRNPHGTQIITARKEASS